MKDEWVSIAADLKFNKNIPWSKLSTELENKTGLKIDNGKIRDRLRALPEYKEWQGKEKEPEPAADLHAEVLKVLDKPCSIKNLAKKLNQSERIIKAVIDDLQETGEQIIKSNGLFHLCKDIIPQENKYEEDWQGNKIIRFGLCGDMQFNSKWTQITHLHNFYDICEREGIKTIYNTGDIDEGEGMRKGHQYECYNQGADDHEAEIIKNYPQRKGIITKFITGNHDLSMIKNCGHDIGKAIAYERKDMIYLGQSCAIINLTPNCTLELRHPIDGTAYAISYKIQKMIEAMSGGEKPNILAVGHYHKAEYIFYRNVHCVQTGCFQAQTNWERGKQIAVMMGGWIIEVHVDSKGTIQRFKNEFIPYYKAIKDDYMGWR